MSWRTLRSCYRLNVIDWTIILELSISLSKTLHANNVRKISLVASLVIWRTLTRYIWSLSCHEVKIDGFTADALTVELAHVNWVIGLSCVTAS